MIGFWKEGQLGVLFHGESEAFGLALDWPSQTDDQVTLGFV